jgi:hypothetical protein
MTGFGARYSTKLRFHEVERIHHDTKKATVLFEPYSDEPQMELAHQFAQLKTAD